VGLWYHYNTKRYEEATISLRVRYDFATSMISYEFLSLTLTIYPNPNPNPDPNQTLTPILSLALRKYDYPVQIRLHFGQNIVLYARKQVA